MTREQVIEKLKEVLQEATETEDAVCYITSDDKEWLKFCIISLEVDEAYQLEYENTGKEQSK